MKNFKIKKETSKIKKKQSKKKKTSGVESGFCFTCKVTAPKHFFIADPEKANSAAPNALQNANSDIDLGKSEENQQTLEEYCPNAMGDHLLFACVGWSLRTNPTSYDGKSENINKEIKKSTDRLT